MSSRESIKDKFELLTVYSDFFGVIRLVCLRTSIAFVVQNLHKICAGKRAAMGDSDSRLKTQFILFMTFNFVFLALSVWILFYYGVRMNLSLQGCAELVFEWEFFKRVNKNCEKMKTLWLTWTLCFSKIILNLYFCLFVSYLWNVFSLILLIYDCRECGAMWERRSRRNDEKCCGLVRNVLDLVVKLPASWLAAHFALILLTTYNLECGGRHPKKT